MLANFGTISAIFNEKFEIRDRCKGVHCVDLGESFPTDILLQNLASIQPFRHLFVPLRYLQFLKIVRSTAAAAFSYPSGTFSF